MVGKLIAEKAKIKGITDIFFDLDHTLWDFQKNSSLTFDYLLKKYKIDIDLNEFLKILYAEYKDKKKIFTSPAFNFDEISELPKNAILLSSDKVNNVMGVSFSVGNSEIIGLQYHQRLVNVGR